LGGTDPAAIFKNQIDQASAVLRQILVHNPPSHLQSIVNGIAAAEHILFVAEGELRSVAQIASAQLHRAGLPATASPADTAQLAVTLADLRARDVVIGINGTNEGADVARVLAFARGQGCRTYAVVGKLDGLMNRWADSVLYVPLETDMLETDTPETSITQADISGADDFGANGSGVDVVSITGALTALAQAVMQGMAQESAQGEADGLPSPAADKRELSRQQAIHAAYRFLTDRSDSAEIAYSSVIR